MDTSLYLDVNRFAVRPAWAHRFMHDYALYAGVVFLALLVFVAFLRARRDSFGDGAGRVAATLWTAAGVLAALGLNQPLAHAIGRVRPYDVLRGVEVLVPRANDFTMPSDHATVAGAAIVGLWLSRDRLIAAIATAAGLFLAFARVYVGAHYPGDVLAGLAFGGVVMAIGYLLLIRPLRDLVRWLATTPLGVLVGGGRHVTPVDAGPAARPTALQQTGSVKLLSEHGLRPQNDSPVKGAAVGARAEHGEGLDRHDS